MPKTPPPKNLKEFPLAFVQETIALATSGFGLVVALAWNEFVKDLIVHYIQPLLGDTSGLASKLIYALFITFLAVLVTMQLVRVEQTLKHLLPNGEGSVEKTSTKATKKSSTRKKR